MLVSNQDVLKVLRSARRRIATPERWIKGAMERHEEGKGVRYCLLGAIYSAAYAGKIGKEARCCHVLAKATRNVVRKRLPSYYADATEAISLAMFNDRPATTHKDVYKVLTRAIKEVEAKCRT